MPLSAPGYGRVLSSGCGKFPHTIKGKHTIPYPENLNFQILVFGPFTPQIEEWRGRGSRLPRMIKGKHTIPYPENLNFQILVFGPFTPQIEEWQSQK